MWDGGVYDNLGVESLFKNGEIARKECDFLIVSDASAPFEESHTSSCKVRAALRLVDIAMNQVTFSKRAIPY